MNYIRLSDNKYPFSEKEIRKLYPSTTFATPFKKEGFEVVFSTPKPEYNSLQIVIENAPVLTIKETWEQSWEIVDRFQDILDGSTKEEQEVEFLATELSDRKNTLQEDNRLSCTAFIIERYPESKQRSAALGVYSQDIIDGMSDHITRIVAEENRVFDLLEAATTIEELELVENPIWPSEE